MSVAPRRRLILVAIAALLAAGCADAPRSPAPSAEFARVSDRGDTVEIDAGSFAVTVTKQPLGIVARDDRGEVFRQATTGEAGSLYFVRGGVRVTATAGESRKVARRGVQLAVRFADGGSGVLLLSPLSANAVAVELSFDQPDGITSWGEVVHTPRDERIYGLTERIVDSFADSEVSPKPVGSLDRKGEAVEMYTMFTIGGYVPLYQSSRGYGLLVEGTMPGLYDVGKSDPELLRFEFELDPTAKTARYDLLFGPSHYEILNQYTAITGRPFLPPRFMFLHWKGRDELEPGDPVTVDGVPLNPTLADDLVSYQRYDIPPGVYHFDRPWAVGQEGFGDFAFDGDRFPDTVGMLRTMRGRGWHVDVWQGPWAIGARGEIARARGYLAPGADREIDFTNPDAVAWPKDGLRAFLTGPEGSFVDAFFLDRGEEFQPSGAGDVYFDGSNGRQIHNAYTVQYAKIYREVLDETRGSESFAWARGAYTGEQQYAAKYGGDTHNRDGVEIPEVPNSGAATDFGLRSVLISNLRCAFMGIPAWGSNVGGISDIADRESFARWLEVGAAMPIMFVFGKGSHAPWDMPTEPHFDEELLAIYRRYVRLHHALNDYLYGLAREAHETGAPLSRPLVFNYPDDPRTLDLWDEWLLGNDLLVAPVWQSGARGRTVYLPRGRWVDFWDRARTIDGPADLDEAVPLDRLPLFVAEGSPLLELPLP